MKVSNWGISAIRNRSWGSLKWFKAVIRPYIHGVRTLEPEIGLDLIRHEGTCKERVAIRMTFDEAHELSEQLRAIVEQAIAQRLTPEEPEEEEEYEEEEDLFPGWED